MTRWPTLRTPPRDTGRDSSAVQNGDSPKLRTRDAVAAKSASQPSRLDRLRQPLPLLGIVLVLIALIGYLAVYSSRQPPHRRAGTDPLAAGWIHASGIRS